MLYEANMGNSKPKSDAFFQSYWSPPSNQHCFRGEGVYILSGVTEKRQESEINTIVWVFQLLLAGIVDPSMVRRGPNYLATAFSRYSFNMR